MTEHHSDSHHDEIHLPPPSIAPMLVAGGMTLTGIGIVMPPMILIGPLVLAGGIAIWAFGPQ